MNQKPEFDPHDYFVRLLKKQLGISTQEAEKLCKTIDPNTASELVNLGRAGEVQAVRSLLSEVVKAG